MYFIVSGCHSGNPLGSTQFPPFLNIVVVYLGFEVRHMLKYDTVFPAG